MRHDHRPAPPRSTVRMRLALAIVLVATVLLSTVPFDAATDVISGYASAVATGWVVRPDMDISTVQSIVARLLTLSTALALVVVGLCILGVVLLTRTVRRRIATEQRLRAASDQLAEIIRMTPVMVAVLDAELHFLRVNPAGERILGWSVDELEGAAVAHHVHPDDLPPLRAAEQRLSEGRRLHDLHLRCRHRDGAWRWLSWNAVATKTEELRRWEAADAAVGTPASSH